MITRPISLNDYWQGRDKAYAAEWKKEYELDATVLLIRVNNLFANYDYYPAVRSGWRPASINAKVGGSPKSWHLVGKAIDLSDNTQEVTKWLMKKTNLLKHYDLYMEMPDKTPTWCHLQTVAPKSGNRVFWP